MPTILRVGPNRFFFYANERSAGRDWGERSWWRTRTEATRFVLSVLGPLRGESGGSMRKGKRSRSNELHPEYDFSSMKGGVRGKYAARLRKESNLVLLEPDVASAFPTEARAVLKASQAVRCRRPNRPIQRTAGGTGRR